jgi:DNA-binding NarL/FixJ family response regulator
MLLRLLSEGMTQQEVARRLQLSARTISRRTAELKRNLGAASPLQAGLEAARRGWLLWHSSGGAQLRTPSP